MPTCPVAVATNFNVPINPSNGVEAARTAAAPLIAAGLKCLTEAYLNENPNATPDNLNNIARTLGWAHSQPVFGVYPVGGNPPPSYGQWRDWSGWSAYLSEYLPL